MIPDFEKFLPILASSNTEFILIGGVAAIVHGLGRATYDIDLVYHRTLANYARLAAALAPHRPYLRGAPPGLPFSWDERTIRNGLNFTLTTELGDIDLLGEVPGDGTYPKLLPGSIQIEAFGARFLCVNLPTLIRLKRASGRPKDLETIAELEALRRTRSG